MRTICHGAPKLKHSLSGLTHTFSCTIQAAAGVIIFAKVAYKQVFKIFPLFCFFNRCFPFDLVYLLILALKALPSALVIQLAETLLGSLLEVTELCKIHKLEGNIFGVLCPPPNPHIHYHVSTVL